MLWTGAKVGGARASLMRIVAAPLLALLLAPTSVTADVTVVTPLHEQYPNVAHLDHDFTWAFLDTTFNSSTDGPISYTASGLPSWVSFDSSTRVFSGSPSSQEDIGTTEVAITANDGSGVSANSTFGLFVTSDSAPVLHQSLVSQLPSASSLGRSQILTGTKLHIPYGWSFSVGWQGSTFELPSGRRVYTYGTINGLEPLPGWLHYSPDTYAMWGIAPNSAPSEGTEFVFVMSGANEPGYAGTQTNITIVLGEGKLSLSTSATANAATLQTVNATVGLDLNYTLPSSLISIDGQAVRNSNAISLAADTREAGSWLSFDQATQTFRGIPPSDVVMDSADHIDVTIPVTVTDSLENTLTFSLPLAIYPAVFSNDTLPNVYVEAGQPFNASLADYIRNGDQANISVSYDPIEATSWISYDQTSYLFSGTAPTDFSEASKVAVTLINNAKSDVTNLERLSRRDTPANQAAFYVALSGTEPGSPVPAGSPIPEGDGTGPAESRRKRAIIGAVLGILLGLLLIALLIFCCLRRHRKEEEARTAVSSIATKSPALSSSDERTLHDDTSPSIFAAPFKKMKNKDGASPATLFAGSPYLDPNGKQVHAEQQVVANGGELRGILITSDRYARQSAEQEERYTAYTSGPYDDDVYGQYPDQRPEQPQQHNMMAALVSGQRSAHQTQDKHQEEAARIVAGTGHARSQSAGLGLLGVQMEGSGSPEDEPYRRRSAHTRSRMSLRSSVSRESWEDDLFYEESARDSRVAEAGSFDGSPQTRTTSIQALNAIKEEEEVPRRRGEARVSSRYSHMRHRSAHTKTSPTFATTAVFGAPASDESDDHDRSYAGEQFVKINSTESREAPMNDFVIGTAQRVDVRELGRNGSVNARTPQIGQSHERSQSLHADAQRSSSGAFEDADDDAAPLPQGFRSAPQGRGNRDSAFSTMTTDSNMIALSPYISYPEPEEGTDAMSVSVYSPRPPSMFGGASIASNIRPEDTLRKVDYSRNLGPPSPLLFPPSPASLHPPRRALPAPGHGPIAPPTPMSRPHSAIVPEELEAVVSMGMRMRIKLTPPGGPSMRGAAGSAGARAGQKGKYVPLLDDVNMQAHGTWPNWLSEWIFWDPSMFEISGQVPMNFWMEKVTIALVHRKTAAGSASLSPVPGSPKRGSTYGVPDGSEAGYDDEVVARLTLVIEQANEIAYDVPLQRVGAATAF